MEYTIKRRRGMRSVRIRVETNGQVVITAPLSVPKSFIMSFALQHSQWISRQQEKIKLRNEVFPVLDWEREIVSYLGNLYTIRFAEGAEKVKLGTSYIYVSPVTGMKSHVKRTMLRWLKTEAEKWIRVKTIEWATKMRTEFKSIGFRQQKSRWGSCGPKNELSFNWRLIHYKPEVIEYVIIHELAHTKHHNHSERFWKVVRTFQPAMEQYRSFLRKQMIPLEKVG